MTLLTSQRRANGRKLTALFLVRISSALPLIHCYIPVGSYCTVKLLLYLNVSMQLSIVEKREVIILFYEPVCLCDEIHMEHVNGSKGKSVIF